MESGVFTTPTLVIDGKDISTFVERVDFLDLSDTMPNWKMDVYFSKEPGEFDLFSMVGNVYPIQFAAYRDRPFSLEQTAGVSNFLGNGITFRPSKN